MMIFQSLPRTYNSQVLLILLSLSTLIDNTGSSITSWNGLLDTNHCVCPEDTLIYECCIASEPGVGSTLWKGSALAGQCPHTGGEIVLRHRTFMQNRTCGNITGRGIGVEENGCYTSQLRVTVDSSLDNKTVECTYDNGTTTTVIGVSIIEIIKDIFPPPNNIVISDLTVMDELSIQVTFEWSRSAVLIDICPTQSYIITSNCGLCPNSTTATDTTVRVTCTRVFIGQLCTFSISTHVCKYSPATEGNTTSESIIAAVFDAVRNEQVEVTFDANYTRATCKFLQWQPLKSSQCMCSISYGKSQPYIQSPVEASWSDTVVLNLATESLPPDEYHFIVTATYGTFSILVEGTFIKQKSMGTTTQSAVSVLVFGISLGTMGVIVFLIVVFLSVVIAVVLIRSKKNPKNEPTSVSELPINTERNVAYEVIQL